MRDLNQLTAVGPSCCKIRPKESDSQAKAFSSPSHCVPVLRGGNIQDKCMAFTKLILCLCVPFFQGNTTGEMGQPGRLAVGGSELGWSLFAGLAQVAQGFEPGPCWQDCCNLLSLRKRATGCLGFLKSLSFKNLSFLKQMCHLKLFTALGKSKRTFEAQLTRLYLPVSFTHTVTPQEGGWLASEISL